MISLEHLGEKLDDMGYTLTYANDPVEGSTIVVLDWRQVAGLVADFEDALYEGDE